MVEDVQYFHGCWQRSGKTAQAAVEAAEKEAVAMLEEEVEQPLGVADGELVDAGEAFGTGYFLGVMDDRDIGEVMHLITCLPQPDAVIHVFRGIKDALVEEAGGVDGFLAQQPAGGDGVIHQPGAGGGLALLQLTQGKVALQLAGDGGKDIDTQLEAPIGVDQFWRDQAGPGLGCLVGKHGLEGCGIHVGIGIEDEYRPALGPAQRQVARPGGTGVFRQVDHLQALANFCLESLEDIYAAIDRAVFDNEDLAGQRAFVVAAYKTADAGFDVAFGIE